MQEKTMRGVYPILVTPFDEKSRVDEESLRSLVEFNLKAGVHGLGVAMGSEILRLSEAERVQVTRIIVDQARGRVPVVINTSATGTELALVYSKMAEGNGADALMLTPPIPMGMGTSAGPAGIREYFKAISDAVNIPIFIQSTSSTPVGASLARHIAEESENVGYIKEETTPPPARIAEAVKQAGDLLVVFGGAGGNYFVEEMRRGSQGTMPSCSQPEAFVKVWNLFHSGDEKAASELLHQRILRVNRLSGLTWGGFFHVNKEILRQRGIIRTAVVRGPVVPLDELTRQELQAVIDELYGSER